MFYSPQNLKKHISNTLPRNSEFIFCVVPYIYALITFTDHNIWSGLYTCHEGQRVCPKLVI